MDNEQMKAMRLLIVVIVLVAVTLIIIINAQAGTHDRLIQALIHVESNGSPNAVGDNGKAVGVLQIHPIMVRDCNRITKRNKYSLGDRYSVVKSIEMFNVWRKHYCKGSSDEVIARKWNGGQKGHRMKATVKYWKKVKTYLERK